VGRREQGIAPPGRRVRTALIEVLSGWLELTVDGARYDAARGFWLRMAAESPHALVAEEPSVMLLTLAGG
jgi:quercetin dioxygenase-like cupin family protein